MREPPCPVRNTLSACARLAAWYCLASAAAAEAMLDQAASLAQAVSVFRTGQGGSRLPLLVG